LQPLFFVKTNSKQLLNPTHYWSPAMNKKLRHDLTLALGILVGLVVIFTVVGLLT